MSNPNNKEKKIKINIPSIICTFLLTPIFEKILTPIYDYIANKFLSISHDGIQFISSLVYTRISQGVYINIPFYIFIIIISFLLSLVLFFSVLHPYQKTNSCCDATHPSSCAKRQKLNIFTKLRCLFFNPEKRRKFMIVNSVLLYIIFILFILSTNFINNTITRTTNNIEIVSPYISDYDYKMLKSKFYSMNSRTDFDYLYSLLEQYSQNANVELK